MAGSYEWVEVKSDGMKVTKCYIFYIKRNISTMCRFGLSMSTMYRNLKRRSNLKSFICLLIMVTCMLQYLLIKLGFSFIVQWEIMHKKNKTTWYYNDELTVTMITTAATTTATTTTATTTSTHFETY